MATTKDTTTRTTTTDASDMSRLPSSMSQEGIGQGVRQAADTVAGVAGDLSAKLPDVAQQTRAVFDEANRAVSQGSDSTLRMVGAASVGFAVGLLIGGANRLLVVGALVPAALIGWTLMDRLDTSGSTRPAGRTTTA
jgi:hypothetical protein